MSTRRLDTKLIHAGEPQPRIDGAVSMPIFQTSTFRSGEAGSYDDLRYLRLNNTPNHHALHAKLAAIEGAEAALVTASGMAAISTALLSVLRPGDHVLAQSTLYGGTFSLLTEDLADLGIELTFFDGRDPQAAKAALRPTTKVLYCETLTNPRVQMAALPELASFAKDHGLISMVDNTFASPVNVRPVELGFDVVLHSATKYLNGHSDIVAGAIVGRKAFVDVALRKLNLLGACLDPHACFLLHRGLKTLAVRVRQQNATALTLARALEQHSAVSRVDYPGLESHPDHVRARELLRGFGGMLSFEVAAGAEAAASLLNAFKLAMSAPSLGGPETLVTRPCDTSHKGMTPEQRMAAGVSDALIRVSVGLEDADDLVADFTRALG
ncbi:MAG: aminotransferase class I/II-fold pyridoxal phosphate-dependent enzyme [Myxococcota bacterium]